MSLLLILSMLWPAFPCAEMGPWLERLTTGAAVDTPEITLAHSDAESSSKLAPLGQLQSEKQDVAFFEQCDEDGDDLFETALVLVASLPLILDSLVPAPAGMVEITPLNTPRGAGALVCLRC